MTEEQVLEKIESMLPEVMELIKRKTEKALSSGAINLDDFEDNYLLPKMILSAIGKEIEFSYRPPQSKHQKYVNNLWKFL